MPLGDPYAVISPSPASPSSPLPRLLSPQLLSLNALGADPVSLGCLIEI